MAKGLGAAFAAGLLVGTDRGLQRNREQERQDRRDAMLQDEHDARMAEIDRQNRDRVALADAARPVTVNQGASVDLGDGTQKVYDNADVAASDVRQARRLADATGGVGASAQSTPTLAVGGKAYGDQASADAAAAAANRPEATARRVSAALAQQGKPEAALAYQQKAEDFAQKRWQRSIGMAMNGGFDGLAALINDSEVGPFQGKRVKPLTSPDGKSVTLAVVGEDGSETPTSLTFSNDQHGVIQAAYMLDQSIPPDVRYKHMVDQDRQAAAVTAKEKELALRERELNEVKIPNAETRAQLAEVRGQLADLRAARGDSGVTREERIRYTTLFTDAGRRMQDVSKSLNTLRADRAFMKRSQVAGSPEAQQLADLQEQLASHKQERDLYQGLLAGSQTGGKGGGSDAALAPSDGGTPRKVPPATQAARDGDRVQILNDELAKAKQRLQDGDQRAQGDIDALNREISAAQPRLASARGPTASPKTGGTRDNPAKVTSAAERDKLPKGAYYTAPNGQTYIKQ